MKKRVNITATVFDRYGRVLSKGQNSYVKTHPKQKYFAEKNGKSECIYLHAEIAAIIKCKHPRKIHRIFIERYDHSGNPKLAKPCEICQSMIDGMKIPVVDFTRNEERK